MLHHNWSPSTATWLAHFQAHILAQRLGDVKFGFFHDLHLANHAVLQWEDPLALLLNLLADDFGDQFFHLPKNAMANQRR